tara:strand:- start:971 stop:1510 length:540 start_codon:yes stop_codon:yes gene_type:complete
MTNRLKILSAILVISLFIFGNSLINDPTKQKKEIVSAKTNTAPISKESTNQPVINSNSKNNYKSFKPISDDKKNDFVWTRNPFDSGLGKKTTINSSSTSELQSQSDNSNNPLVKQSDIQGVTDLKIESVAIIGETAIVIINGYRYREGDRISSLTIDKIEPNKITFRSGRTQIIRDVGT